MKVGIGFDAHRLAPGRPLVLGGVGVPFDRGLEGHSDADVVVHAVIDSLLGAAGLGDIGTVFPSSDSALEGADGLEMLRLVAGMLAGEYLRAESIDVVVIAERPALAPYRDEMGRLIAEAAGALPGAAHVKATTTDGMGFTGGGEGIAAMAVALVSSL